MYDLPLASGVLAHRSSMYFKTQDNVVSVFAQVELPQGFPSGGIISTLPVGFRLLNSVGSISVPSTTFNSAPLEVEIDNAGNIRAYINGEVAQHTYLSFIANYCASDP